MSAEIQSIAERCSNCGQAIAFAIVYHDLDDNGAERAQVRTERVPHGRPECDRMLRLERETWPTLF